VKPRNFILNRAKTIHWIFADNLLIVGAFDFKSLLHDDLSDFDYKMLRHPLKKAT